MNRKLIGQKACFFCELFSKRHRASTINSATEMLHGHLKARIKNSKYNAS